MNRRVTQCEEFDFDLMARLAKEDPAEFARRREELIRRTIESFPNPELGHRFQCEIDMERMRTPPGEQTYVAMAKKMSALLAQMSDLFTSIQSIAQQARLAQGVLAKEAVPPPGGSHAGTARG